MAAPAGKHKTIEELISTHFSKEEVEYSSEQRHAGGPKVAKRKHTSALKTKMYSFTCLTCYKTFRDVSNKKALRHKLLSDNAGKKI